MRQTNTTADTPSATDRAARSIRVLIASRHTTIVALAKHLSLTPQAVQRRLTGRTQWRLDELESAADHLGTDLTGILAAADRLDRQL